MNSSSSHVVLPFLIWGLNILLCLERCGLQRWRCRAIGDTDTCACLGLWFTVGTLQASPRKHENLKQAQGNVAEKTA